MPSKGRPAEAPGLLAQLDAIARAAVPAMTTAAAMVLAATPAGPPSLVPAVALVGVFYWSLFRPGSMPAAAAFVLGLLQDLLGFAPLGVGALTLLLVQAGALRARPVLAPRSFAPVWLGLLGAAAVAAGLGYLLQALLGWALPPLRPAVVQLGLSAGLYPILAPAMSLLRRGMQRAEAIA